MKTRNELVEELQAKAREDRGFRDLLLQDPAGAVKEAVGIEVPDTINLYVHEETASDRHLVISADDKMSEAELEIIAGGADGSGVWGSRV